MIEKTVYPNLGKVVLEDDTTGIMIETTRYNHLSAVLTDEQIFREFR